MRTYAAVVLPYLIPQGLASPSPLKVPEVEAAAVLWARRAAALQESCLPSLSPWSACPVWPQVGVSEAGLQHEILRRARDLLDVARLQPGTYARLFPELFGGPAISGCGWQPRGRWLQIMGLLPEL